MPFALTSRTSMPRSVASTRRNCGVVTKISSWRSDSQIPPLSTSCGVTALIVSLLSSPPALAAGLQSADISGFIPAAPQEWIKANDDKRAQLQSDEERFSQSPTLKALLEKSEANKAQNMKDIRDKYCYRQAELGIGDCGGLRYLPGLTQNGKQETPQWLADLLGVEVPQQPQATKGKTLQELIRPEGGGEALN